MVVDAYRNAVAASAGTAIDMAIGERFLNPHPVAVFGSFLEKLEQRMWRDSKGSGAIYTATALAGAMVPQALVPRGWARNVASSYVASAPSGLWGQALEVKYLLESGDLVAARRSLSAIVGRSTETLSVGEVCAAAIEAVAEGTVDAVVGPLFWGSVLGAHGSAGFRALNTLDSMVGYKSQRYRNFGWASARADDAACYLPARLSLLSLLIAMPLRSPSVLSAVREYSKNHESPNAGLMEAAFAGALKVSLGRGAQYPEKADGRSKPSRGHELDTPSFGSGPAPTIHDIGRAVSISKSVTIISAGLLVTTSRYLVRINRRNRRSEERAIAAV